MGDILQIGLHDKLKLHGYHIAGYHITGQPGSNCTFTLLARRPTIDMPDMYATRQCLYFGQDFKHLNWIYLCAGSLFPENKIVKPAPRATILYLTC